MSAANRAQASAAREQQHNQDNMLTRLRAPLKGRDLSNQENQENQPLKQAANRTVLGVLQNNQRLQSQTQRATKQVGLANDARRLARLLSGCAAIVRFGGNSALGFSYLTAHYSASDGSIAFSSLKRILNCFNCCKAAAVGNCPPFFYQHQIFLRSNELLATWNLEAIRMFSLIWNLTWKLVSSCPLSNNEIHFNLHLTTSTHGFDASFQHFWQFQLMKT